MTGLQTVYGLSLVYRGNITIHWNFLRILLMGSINLTISCVLYVVRTRQIKEGVTTRSLGLPIRLLRREYGISLIFELIMMFIMMILQFFFG